MQTLDLQRSFLFQGLYDKSSNFMSIKKEREDARIILIPSHPGLKYPDSYTELCSVKRTV
jgi:hypothetical protein